MTIALNETHDPAATSWVESANRDGTDFPIQNLPFGVFRRTGSGEAFRGGVAIGDWIVDLTKIDLPQDDKVAVALEAAKAPRLNALMALGTPYWSALRRALFGALKSGAPKQDSALAGPGEVQFAVPAMIGDFTDFYASIHHATAVGKMLRPENPLLPNYKWVPIAYHGRSSSIGVSGQFFLRPLGQSRPQGTETPVFGPTQRLDFELELGFYIGPGTVSGMRVPVAEASRQVFGVSLLNDWSARDIQAWEYQPLGPFLGKNFATTVSPWIVTLEALAPFRVALERAPDDPPALPYLALGAEAADAAIDIHVDVTLQSRTMRRTRLRPHRIALSNYRHAYWSFQQMVAHHSSNGCALRPGDLLGTGTLSGPEPQAAGSLLELAQGGNTPLILPSGEERRFIEDGDRVALHGWCTRPGAKRIGFGRCSGLVFPAAEAR